METLPFALIVILAGVLSSGDGMLRTLMLCCLFGATATLSLPGLGGAPITPAVLLLPFLFWRALQDRGLGNVVQQVAFPSAGFWLMLLVIWGVLSALFVPRLFAGATLVFSTDRGFITGPQVQLQPLKPSSTNLTQSAYAIGGLMAFVAVRSLLQAEGRMSKFRDAVLLLGVVNCLAALLDLAELKLGLPSLLTLVRNANYAILTGAEVGGLVRISGTFPETSAFSAFTLPIFAFSACLWHAGVRKGRSGGVALASLVLLLLSTSSTAYAALLVYGMTVACFLVACTMLDVKLPRLGKAVLLLWTVAVAVCLVILLRPDFVDRVWQFFEITLFKKMDSDSGIERGSWNLQAWTNFIDTYGVGTGLGSARSSSFLLVLLSNLGVIGCLLFGAFLLTAFRSAFGAGSGHDVAVARAAGLAALAALIAASISATVFDLGMAFYAYAAAAAAPLLATERRAAAQVRRRAHA